MCIFTAKVWCWDVTLKWLLENCISAEYRDYTAQWQFENCWLLTEIAWEAELDQALQKMVLYSIVWDENVCKQNFYILLVGWI